MNNGDPADVTTDDSSSFKYKSSILGNPSATGVLRKAKIVVLLKYLYNCFRPLEMTLINCKIYVELSWTINCVMSSIEGATTFRIISTKLYDPIVTLSTKDNVNLTKQLNERFKRPAYWIEYKLKIRSEEADASNPKRFPLDTSFQGANRLFFLAFDNTNNRDNKVEINSHRKYFLPRVNIANYSVLINGKDFYDQPINNQIRKYDEIRKIATGKGDDYTTGCLLDYQYFKDHYELIAADLSKQKKIRF